MADDDAATPSAAFKKPTRRGNIRKRAASAIDDADASPAQGTSCSLEVMKELQRQRHRSKGVTLDPKGGTELEAPPEDADEQSQGTHNLSSTFTAQTEAGEVDPKMLQYIEEQMRKEEGAQETLAPSFDADEEELYTTAAHLQVARKARLGREAAVGQAAELEDAQRWLAGIMEVPLSAEEKMASIEQTEKAKRLMMQSRAAPKPQGMLDIPGNFNANFHLHRRETAMTRKANAQAGGVPARPTSISVDAGGGAGQVIPIASDQSAVERFRRNERDMGRR